jgi:hypothetical protein
MYEILIPAKRFKKSWFAFFSMKLQGPCYYCSRIAYQTCKMCGALSCESHFDPDRSICSGCLTHLEEKAKAEKEAAIA